MRPTQESSIKPYVIALVVLVFYVIAVMAYMLVDSDTPEKIYGSYIQLLKDRAPYHKLKELHTRKQQEAVENQIAQYVEKTGKSRAEIIRMLSDINWKIEQCKERKLIGRSVNEEEAVLIYELKDSCSDQVPTQKEQVELSREDDRWKIGEIAVVL